jgi:hypothetical protein
MQVDHRLDAGSFEQVVFVGRHHQHLGRAEMTLKQGQRALAAMRQGDPDAGSAFVVPPPYDLRMGAKSIGMGEVFRTMGLPKTAFITKGWNSGIGAATGADNHQQTPTTK